jgi:outer membrane protein assembly factor BamA
MSFRWGLNRQLTDGSRTYPDRLFFLGGVDSLRGFLQDSLVPEDVADKLLDPDSGLGIDQIVIRGGDVFINPRLELRVPLTDSVQTAIFVDAGNLWADPDSIEPLRLRYATGSGLRIGTPIGPLVFDYGFNVERVLDAFDRSRRRQRYWESIGAFHFSIGLF